MFHSLTSVSMNQSCMIWNDSAWLWMAKHIYKLF